jgi:hypothetical protein
MGMTRPYPRPKIRDFEEFGNITADLGAADPAIRISNITVNKIIIKTILSLKKDIEILYILVTNYA